MPHFVYILQSLKDKRYYIGETADVDGCAASEGDVVGKNTTGQLKAGVSLERSVASVHWELLSLVNVQASGSFREECISEVIVELHSIVNHLVRRHLIL